MSKSAKISEWSIIELIETHQCSSKIMLINILLGMAKHDSLVSIFEKLFERITGNTPTLIAIDGVDGAGKSIFAKRLADYLRDKNLNVIHSSVDHFHNPKVIRHSPEMKTYQAYFENSFDYSALKTELLNPIKLSSREYCILDYFDYKTDSKVSTDPVKIMPDTILVFDGIFSNRDELKDYWDISIFLDVNFEESYKRMSIRDGCPCNPKDKLNERYYQGQRLYIERCDPRGRATMVINNNDYENPKIVEIKADSN